jgi:hypothetical protein
LRQQRVDRRDVVERQRRIERPHRGLHRRHDGRRIARRPHDERHRSERDLRERHEHLGPRFAIQRVVPQPADDPDNVQRQPAALPVDRDALAHGVGAGPVALRDEVVDDGDGTT